MPMPKFTPEEIEAFMRAQQPRPVSPNPLSALRDDIREHWEECRPKMYARLQKAGTLEEAIETAYLLTEEEVNQLCANPQVSLLAAFEAVRQKYAILPTEEDVPVLPNGDPDTWTRPYIPEEEED